MQENTENTVKYSLVGFDGYVVTEGARCYRSKHYKHKSVTQEVTPDAKGLYALYINKKVAIRCTMEKLLTAAKSQLDPRDDKVDDIIRFNRLQLIQQTPAERVRAAKNKPELVGILLKEFEKPLLAELEKRDLVNDGSRMLSNIAAMTYYTLLRAFNTLSDEDRLIAVEISREGNERSTKSAEVTVLLDLLKEMREQFKQLGITYQDVQKLLPQVVKEQTLFDKFDEAEEVDSIGELL